MGNVIDETVIINIIVSAGEATALMQQAFFEATNNNLSEVETLLTTANEALVRAHRAQTDLLQSEAAGASSEPSLLMVHAQDHLMNAMLCKQLITNLISLQKEINELKNK